MTSESLLPYYTAQSGSSVGMFNTAMGKLQRQLHKGEYDIFRYAPIFESDFIQITRRGEVIDVHNRVRMVTVGIASTSPTLSLPDIMLLARPATGCEEHAGRGQATKGKSRKATKTLELTRLLPLKFVRISIHDREKQQLRLKFATGRSCYLQLCPPLDAREDLFAYWEKLIGLLRPPADGNSSTYVMPTEDTICMHEEEDSRSPAVADFQGKGDQEQGSIRSLHVVSEVAGATSAAFAGGEGTQHDSHKPPTMPDVATPNTKPTELDKESAAGAMTEAAAAAGVAAGPTAGDLSLAVIKSPAPEQLSTATATKGSKTSIAVEDAANTSPKSIKMALAGAANKSSEGTSSVSTSLSPEAGITVAIAGAETTAKTAEEPLISTLPREGHMSDQAGRQRRASQASDEAHQGRRERRERREKERALRTSGHLRAAESRHKAGGDKITQKPSRGSLASPRASRDDRKEKSRRSPGGSRRVTTHKGISRAPITKESHKPGRSLSTTSSGSTTKRLSRLSSFLRHVKANLTAKTVASPPDKGVDILTETVERNSMEAIIETAESGQGQEILGSVTSEMVETVSFEAP
ncbi:PREDICTED: protein FAM71A [Ceratotherium simum simum]|uniref:Protein FAM71A n=1 Tax=Ceratotherium simum simum TaxID=73337 RepID=A0ABM0HE87_CERSS|nr:PREDICTED: protein FAM71A [Ceratotherium simum simum]